MTVEEYLDHLNTSFAARLLPAVVVLAVLMAVGVVGNILVLFMYTCKSKRGTVTLFIQALAVFDLLSCCVAIPGEIIDMTNNYTFGSHSLCKIMRTVNLFCTVSSGATLVVVAIDRHKRICCPLRKQITPKGATIVVCICAILALIISLPTAILYGSRSISTDLSSVNGTDCSVSDQFANTVFPIAYNGLQMLLFLVGAVTLIVLYSLIGTKVCHHVKQQTVRRKSSCAARSRFSPGGASTCSVYSGNVNTACRVESGFSSFVNGHAATEVTDRFLKANAHIGVTVNVNKKNENGVQCNNSSRRECAEVTRFSSEDVSLPVHGTDCQMIDVKEVKCDVESTTAKFYLHKNEFINKCQCISGNNKEMELESCVQTVKILVTEEKMTEFKHTKEPLTEKQILQRNETESVAENHRENNTTNNDVSCEISKSESHIQRCKAQIFTDVLASAEDEPCSQLDAYSQSIHKICEQTITSYSVQNDDLKRSVLVMEDATDFYDESPIRSLSVVSSELSNSANGPWEASKPDLESSKLHDLVEENADKKRQPNIDRKDIRKPEVWPFESDISTNNNKLQTNNNFLTPTDKTTGINENSDGQDYKIGNNQIPTSNNFGLRLKTTKKRENSFKLKQKYTSIIGASNTPLVRQMSKISGRSDGNVDRLEGKVKVRETEHNGSRRTTLMLLMITVIYVLSFLPHLVLMALKAVDEDILAGLGTSWQLAQNLLIRSYFINSMANPIIYSFFSRNFFRQCRRSRTGCSSG